ncbi:MAG: proline--tRNA ligase [Pseudomonadota bacterium]
MNYSKLLIPTTRNVPKDATMISHVMLLRAGYIKMLTKGIYTFLPLGLRVVKNVAAIVREEMNRAGAQELLMPFVHPAELWQESGRWDNFGPELLKFKNREGIEFCIGPTHEEVITDVARKDLRSYKQLPTNLYQIQTKYRDEPRPRAGLLRCREFVMKDAYSFDVDSDGARESYKKMLVAYARVMARLGLEFRVVKADTGSIGGDLSHEFQVVTPSGEDTLILCDKCTYAVNVELAPAYPDKKEAEKPEVPADAPKAEPVDTPGAKTVDEIAAFLKTSPQSIIKTLIVVYEDKAVAALVRGDRGLNLLKLSKILKERNIFLAGDAEVEKITKAPVGFAGPVGLDVPIYADMEVAAMQDAVCGANQGDKHLVHVHPGRDFEPEAYVDIRKVDDGDACPECGEKLRTEKGIEGGQTFYLGTLYSEKMKATFKDRDGKEKPFDMGCYGSGVTRLAAAVVEHKNNDRGILWPVSVAPFHVTVLPLGADPKLHEIAGNIADTLEGGSISVLLDDRDESPGVKFFDADLLGIPVQVIVGAKGMKEGKVEIRLRDGTKQDMVPVDEAVWYVTYTLNQLLTGLDEYADGWAKKILDVAKL